jgi:hypothetical protein
LRDGVAEAEKQSFEIVLAGFFYFRALDEDVIDDEFVVGNQLLQIEAERRDVGGQFFARFFERHEHAGFVVESRAADEKLHGEEGLAGAGAAADECWASGR